MGRKRRLEYPGAFYHVMSRGNGGQTIYRVKKDLAVFLDCLGEVSERYGLVLHTYCLMTNHYHLIVETPHGNLGAAMHWLNLSFSRAFNRRHFQRGHLLQGRYRAILVDADRYLTWLSRYIHLNPVRARMATEPASYRWSSYRAFIGRNRVPEWLQADLILSRFGKIRREAEAGYRAFVEGAAEEGQAKEIAVCLREGDVLGDEAFVDSLERLHGGESISRLNRPRPSRPAIDTVLESVGAAFRLPVEALLEKGRKGNLARDVAIYLAGRRCGLSGKDLGAHFGGISPAAISMRTRAVREALPWNHDLRKKVSAIEARLDRRED